MTRAGRMWLWAAVAIWPAVVAAADTGGDREAERKALKAAADQYAEARTHCRTLSGSDRRICYAQARAAYRKAEANAVAEFRNTPRARMDAEINAANAEHGVARAKCSAKTGTERSACLREAKAAQREAVAAAVRKERAATGGQEAGTKLAKPPTTEKAQ